MDLIKELLADHRKFNLAISKIQQYVLDREHRYFSDGRKAESSAKVLKHVQQLIDELHAHERREHEDLYPMILKFFPDLRGAIAEIELQHHGLEAAVAELGRIVRGEREASNREIAKRVMELLVLLKSHMRHEEKGLFTPILAAAQEAI